MMKTRIPVPSRRATHSAIPLPTKSLKMQTKKLPLNSREAIISKKSESVKQVLSKPPKIEERNKSNAKSCVTTLRTKCVETQAKKLPLNSRETLVNKKPASVKQVLSKPSKVEEKNKANGKRLSSYKSHNDKKVAGMNNKPLTEQKLLKQKKPIPVRQPPKIVVSVPKIVTKNINQSNRYSSFKSCVDRKAGVSNNKPKTNKSAIHQTKISNQTQKRNKIITNDVKENPIKNFSEKDRAVKAVVVSPIKQTNLAVKNGVDDSEFKDSRFFKSLILNERELSPGIIKICSEDKISSVVNANLLQPSQKVPLHFQSVDELIEEVKRTSSKYYRLNGRLVPLSPQMLKHKEESAEDIADEIKRNSGRYRQRKGNLFHSPLLASQNSLKMAQDVVSEKENLDAKLVDDVRRLSEFRRKNLLNADSFSANRRWTCSVPSKPSIASMNTTEIGAEIRRLAEIRRESGAQLFKKATFLENNYSERKLNPHQKALRELNCLTAKKKDKMKKKVTFFIPSPGSKDVTTTTTAKTDSKLSDISEGSSQNCTPELDLESNKMKINSQSGDSDKNVDDSSIVKTPELNLAVCKLDFDSSPNENVTLPFKVPQINIEPIDNSSYKQIVSLEEKNASKNNLNQFSKFIIVDTNNVKSDSLSSKLSSLKVGDNDACEEHDITDNDPTSFKKYLIDTDSNSYSELSHLKPTECLFQSVHKLTVPTSYPPVNETGQFIVNTDKKIYTPHPVALYSKSDNSSSVSPSFLPGKFSALNSYAPIYTPLVLRNLSHSPEVDFTQIRQRLDFNEKPDLMDRRESQIILQTIPTHQKMNDFLCDQECIILSAQFSGEEIFFRNLGNPIATTLNNGDEMHFIPIKSP